MYRQHKAQIFAYDRSYWSSVFVRKRIYVTACIQYFALEEEICVRSSYIFQSVTYSQTWIDGVPPAELIQEALIAPVTKFIVHCIPLSLWGKKVISGFSHHIRFNGSREISRVRI